MKRSESITLCVFIDAFGWELMRQHRFLDSVLKTKTPLKTVFGYSSTCDPVILTGKMPQETNHFSCFYYNPKESPFGLLKWLACLPKALTRRGRVRRILSRFIGRRYGFTGYFQLYNMPFQHLPLFGYSEQRDLYQSGGIRSGLPTMFDYLRQESIPFTMSDWRKSEVENLADMRAELERGEVSFGYLYLAHLDAVLHEYGTMHPNVTEKIAWYEQELERLIQVAKESYQEVRLFLFSDHGMTDVKETYDIKSQIEALGLKFGKDYVAVYDSTMVRFWFLHDMARIRITKALQEEVLGEIVDKQRLAEYGCDFQDNTYGDLFFLMKPGVLLCPSFMGETPLAGMHGYAPEDKDSFAAFATNCELPVLPKRLDDLMETVLSGVVSHLPKAPKPTSEGLALMV